MFLPSFDTVLWLLLKYVFYKSCFKRKPRFLTTKNRKWTLGWWLAVGRFQFLVAAMTSMKEAILPNHDWGNLVPMVEVMVWAERRGFDVTMLDFRVAQMILQK